MDLIVDRNYAMACALRITPSLEIIPPEDFDSGKFTAAISHYTDLIDDNDVLKGVCQRAAIDSLASIMFAMPVGVAIPASTTDYPDVNMASAWDNQIHPIDGQFPTGDLQFQRFDGVKTLGTMGYFFGSEDHQTKCREVITARGRTWSYTRRCRICNEDHLAQLTHCPKSAGNSIDAKCIRRDTDHPDFVWMVFSNAD